MIESFKKTIYVKPVDRVSVHGYDKNEWLLTDVDGNEISRKPFKRTKAYSNNVNVTTTVTFPPDRTLQRLDTGLDVRMHNPYLGEEPEELRTKYNLDSSWDSSYLEKLVKSEYITKQVFFEVKHKRPRGFYTNELLAPLIFNIGLSRKAVLDSRNIEASFLQRFVYELPDETVKITGGSPRSDIAIVLMEACQKVANRKEDIRAGYHEFYIAQVDEHKAEVKARNDIHMKAVHLLVELINKYPSKTIYQVAALCRNYKNKPIVAGNLTNEAVEDRLKLFINTTSDNKVTHCMEFIKIMELMMDEDNTDLFHIKFIINQALNLKVIESKDGYFIWHSKFEQPNLYKLGTSYDKMVQFFIDQYIKYEVGSDVTNWYKDLLDELRRNDAKLE